LKLYLDSADVASWTLPEGCPPACGVTTNPTLVAQARLPVTLSTYLHLLQAAADHRFTELMLQLPSADASQGKDWQAALSAKAKELNIALTIKLPCHRDWLACIHAMHAAEQPILLTGLSNPVQLLWAHSLKAQYVAPYIGRLANDGRDVWALMEACVAMQTNGPQLLAASIKTPEVLAKLIACGAAAATLPPASLVAWSGDALTDTAIAQFERDIASSLSRPTGQA
jgi:transaldolase